MTPRKAGVGSAGGGYAKSSTVKFGYARWLARRTIRVMVRGERRGSPEQAEQMGICLQEELLEGKRRTRDSDGSL